MATTNAIAQTILAQLGGNRFIAMTGAKGFVGSDNALTFKLPSRFATAGINCVQITLTPADTYRMEFMKINGSTVHQKGAAEDVYVADLRKVFTGRTGLDTNL